MPLTAEEIAKEYPKEAIELALKIRQELERNNIIKDIEKKL